MRKPQVLGVRESMGVLPGFLQPFLTWLTGSPLPGQRQWFSWSSWGRLAVYLLVLAVAVFISGWALAAGGWALVLLPLGWLVISGLQRALYLAVLHNAIHDAFSPARRVNRWVAEAISTLLLVNGYDRFKEDHARWHHGKKLATRDDPDGVFLGLFGFGPGMSRRDAWRAFWRTLWNPAFHGAYAKQRLLTNFKEAPRGRIALALAFHGAVVAGVAATGAWVPFLVVWALPLTIFYQQSSLTQMLSEHHWFMPVKERGKYGAHVTFARHLGNRYPGRSASLRARATWWARLLFVHLPARVWVLVGPDLHVHDYHHRHPKGDWANATFARALDVPRYEGGPAAYSSVWGSIATHMNHVFDRWAVTSGTSAEVPVEDAARDADQPRAS